MTPRLYLLQRGTAFVMVPLVITHLVVIMIAVHGGLSAEEILARTRGSAAWAIFYSVFVFAASIHAGIGMQAIAHEWFGLGQRAAAIAGHIFILFLLSLGLRAVFGVYGL
ncbi:MAG: succinate dehydrogenase [Hyphomicrobiaceae bacterium]|nr:succinate dehydrogenase [Hyphomicrobiaceae bacterium]